MKVLYIEPLKPPRVVEIEHTLSEMRRLVDGDIATTYPWEDKLCLVHNDNAIAEGKPLNRVLEDYDIIRGPFFLAGLGSEDFSDLAPDLIEKYTEKFKYPEVFIPCDGHIAVIRVVSSPFSAEKEKIESEERK